MSFSKSTSSNRQAPSAFSSRPPRAPATSSAFGGRNTEPRRDAPAAFGGGSGSQDRREAPTAFSSGTRVWKNEDGDAPSAFGRRNTAQRDAPAAFGGGASGEDRKRRLEEKAAEGRYRAEQAAAERRKAAEEEERKKKAMDLTCEEYYPTLGGSGGPKKAAKTSTVTVDFSVPAAEPVAAPKSMWAKKAPVPEPEPEPEQKAAPRASGWGAGPTMAQRVAEASARVDAEAALKRMREQEEAARHAASRTSLSYTYVPRRTLDDGFDDDDAYVGQSYEEDEDAEFNADLYSGRRRGDKGVW
jgi:hypothetical protein